MKIKNAVRLYGTRSEMADVQLIVQNVFKLHHQKCVLTSAVRDHDGKSLHGEGFARDYRAKNIQHHIRTIIFNDLNDALPMCDILLHGKGDNIHFHLEYDPKDDPNFQKDKKFWKENGYWPK